VTDAFIAFFGLLAIVFAGLVLTLRQPMRAALALVAHMTCLAGIFACLAVHVVALFQVLIYVGAVMVFMIYTIMLLDDRAPPRRWDPVVRLTHWVIVAAILAVVLLVRVVPAAPPAAAAAVDFGFGAFSVAFMQQYWFHFEVATVLLLVGIVAAWAVLREDR